MAKTLPFSLKNKKINTMLNVLITNDDGPESPLLKPFLSEIQKQGWNVYVAIPNKQQSWTSKAITRYNEIEVKKQEQNMWLISGTPATCVNLAIYNLLKNTEINLVISGPNYGHNVGRSSILSSGTVGAAVEAAIAGKKAIALSFPYFGKPTTQDIKNAVQNAIKTINHLIKNWEKNTDIYNVNIPMNSGKNPKTIHTKIWNDNYKQLFSKTNNNKYVQTGGVSPSKIKNPPEGTDMWAIKNKAISISKINIHF